jgi:hypothetical protein
MAVNPKGIASWGLLGSGPEGTGGDPTQIVAEPMALDLAVEEITVELRDGQ